MANMFAKTRSRYIEVSLYYIIVVGHCSEPGRASNTSSTLFELLYKRSCVIC